MLVGQQDKNRVAAEQVDAEIGFYIHLSIYILVMALLVVLNWQSGDPWWAQWPALGWGLGVLAHGMAVFGRMPRAFVKWRVRKIEERARTET